MCQHVTGSIVVLKERIAYKVILSNTNQPSGPLYPTDFREDGWSKSGIPRQMAGYTTYGYHVFVSEKSAKAYLEFYSNCKILKVRIKGKAIPFSYRNYKGYAVQYWKPINDD